MSKPKWGTRTAILTGALAAMMLAPAAAHAVVLTPNTTADEFNENANACSLREAIEAANTDSATNADGCVQGSGADTIELQPGAVYEITRVGVEGMNVSGDLDIRLGDLTISAPAQGATIDGNGLTTLDRVVEIANFAPPITVTMTNLTIRDGGGPVSAPGISGGGIGLFGATQAHTLNLVNSTLTDNRGIVGGGMNVGNVGIANLRNVTLSANKASVDGGGLASDGTVLFTNGTVTDNAANAEGDFIGGGGGLVPTSDTIQLRNTIVSGNRDDGQGTKENECDGSGAITSLGNSLVGTMTDCTYNAGAGDVIGAVPGVTPLASNGGPVQTHALLASSAALNKGAACETTDARGLARTLGGACDIGAYERATCGTAVVNVIGTEGNDVLQGTSGADGILALGGKDTVAGLAGADGLCGGAGKDSLKGGAGKDHLLGEAGKDRLAGGAGKDRLIGGAGKDNLLGGKGKDRCKGGPGKDKQKGC